uniref:Si:ch211-235o23.1 n=1 Tax=Cyprinus carpio TaxID=7962 RepID=A0A8C1V6M0_CYPCA
MSFFFKGAVTSSPVKTRRQEAEYICHSLDVSHISDSSFECFSTNPLTGSVCVCRRSPRLLASGYYVLTEDSFTTDDEGNVTLTPSHTSVSYKENLVRIFRRKHRARKSPASLLNDVNQPCHSWLEEGVFRRSDPIVPLRSSPWEELDNSYETNTSVSFTYVPTDLVSSPDKMPPQTQLEEEEPPCESCSAHEQSNQSVSGLLDVPPPSMCHLNSYSSSSKTSGGCWEVFLQQWRSWFCFHLYVCLNLELQCAGAEQRLRTSPPETSEEEPHTHKHICVKSVLSVWTRILHQR